MKKIASADVRTKIERKEAEVLRLFYDQSEPTPDGRIIQSPVPRSWKWLTENARTPDGLGYSDSSLFAILESLRHSGILEKVLQNRKPIWRPTQKANKTANQDIWHLVSVLEELKAHRAYYWHGGDKLYNLGFSTSTARDDKSTMKFLPDTAATDMQNYVFNLICDNFKHNKLEIENYKEGKTILAVEIDWQNFTTSVKRIQNFIKAIKSKEKIFTDKTGLNKRNSSVLFDFDLLVRMSSNFGDDEFNKKLSLFLTKFSKSYEFYEIARINSKVLETLISYLDKDEDPLTNVDVHNALLEMQTDEFGYKNPAIIYMIAARLSRYGNRDFIKNLEGLEVRVMQARSEILNKKVESNFLYSKK